MWVMGIVGMFFPGEGAAGHSAARTSGRGGSNQQPSPDGCDAALGFLVSRVGDSPVVPVERGSVASGGRHRARQQSWVKLYVC